MLKKLNLPLAGYGLFFGLIFLLLLPSLSNIGQVFRTEGFDPHGHCFLWQPEILRLYVISDSLIGTSYVAISLILVHLYRQMHEDIPFPYVFLAFGAFIITCGITHFMEIWTLWNPTYWLSGYAKFITALASTGTALMLPYLVPKALRLVQNAKVSDQRKALLVQTNAALEAEIMERRKVLDALRESEARLRTVIENAPVMISTMTAEGTVTMVEGKAAALLPVSATEIVGSSIFNIDESTPGIQGAFEQALSGETGIAITETDDYALEIRFAPIVDSDGGISTVIGVATDISERVQAENDLRRALAKERELNTLRSRFVTSMSHEFRTPLTIISTSAAMIERYSDRMTEDQRRNHIDKIQAQIRTITRMMDDVLLAGKIEADKLEYRPETLTLDSVVREAVESYSVTLPASHTLNTDIDASCPPCHADPTLITSIITNLLSNAVKYSPSGGNITLSLTCDDTSATLIVMDNGIGIPADDLNHIFDNFHRGANISNIPGTGLGLAIVKRAVALHSGTVNVSSTVNQGATFTVILPLTPPDTD